MSLFQKANSAEATKLAVKRCKLEAKIGQTNNSILFYAHEADTFRMQAKNWLLDAKVAKKMIRYCEKKRNRAITNLTHYQQQLKELTGHS